MLSTVKYISANHFPVFLYTKPLKIPIYTQKNPNFLKTRKKGFFNYKQRAIKVCIKRQAKSTSNSVFDFNPNRFNSLSIALKVMRALRRVLRRSSFSGFGGSGFDSLDLVVEVIMRRRLKLACRGKRRIGRLWEEPGVAICRRLRLSFSYFSLSIFGVLSLERESLGKLRVWIGGKERRWVSDRTSMRQMSGAPRWHSRCGRAQETLVVHTMEFRTVSVEIKFRISDCVSLLASVVRRVGDFNGGWLTRLSWNFHNFHILLKIKSYLFQSWCFSSSKFSNLLTCSTP